MLGRRFQETAEVVDVGQHPMSLEKLSQECPNSIRILSSPYPISRYTYLALRHCSHAKRRRNQ
jgi:hypothetical protein